ncbi:MAG: hypothetical protein QG616_880 [Pseudomonadota bacterium]|nr:hypothetical protein [Pseudomonadota bacterium]
MSHSIAPKVVSINATSRERSPGRRIVVDCQEQLSDALCRWLAGIRAPIAEELFLLADGTRERLLQTRYLDLRQDVEREWTQFIEACRHSFLDADYKPKTEAGALDVPDFDGLQLVADDELSERIVVREFAARLAETCDAEIYPLDRRVAALLGREELAEGENPLATIHFCQALADASAALGLDAESRLLLMRRIERHLHLVLPAFYHDVNANLIERGILPDLKRDYRRASKTPTSGSAENAAVAMLQAAAENLPVSAGDILGTMQRLAAARSVGTPPGVPEMPGMPGNVAGVDVPLNAATISHAFLTSLNEVQHMEWKPGAGMAVNQVRALRDSGATQQVAPLEAVTIDIVAMLFDFIFNDGELPATVKSLVGQLQIPVLKVAMLDHTFFANRQHPARRFLDGITGIALHWGNGAKEGDPFIARLEILVSRIQQEFETNVEIFAEAIAELEAFVTAHEAQESATLEIAADAVIRRETEEAAAERVKAALQPLLAKPQPGVVREFIAEHWASVMQHKALSHEADHPAWQDTIEVAEQLIWSVAAKTESDERLRLISALPMLLARINAGLSLVGTGAEIRGTFFDALVELHAAALKGAITNEPAQAAVTSTDATVPSEGDLLVTRHVEEGIVIEEVMLVGATPMRRARDRDALEQVRSLKRGDWVDFIDDEGGIARERLNWVSPQKGILVFSNHRAAKAITISPEALARRFLTGAACVVEQSSVFDRAIDGVMHSLGAA